MNPDGFYMQMFTAQLGAWLSWATWSVQLKKSEILNFNTMSVVGQLYFQVRALCVCFAEAVSVPSAGKYKGECFSFYNSSFIMVKYVQTLYIGEHG